MIQAAVRWDGGKAQSRAVMIMMLTSVTRVETQELWPLKLPAVVPRPSSSYCRRLSSVRECQEKLFTTSASHTSYQDSEILDGSGFAFLSELYKCKISSYHLKPGTYSPSRHHPSMIVSCIRLEFNLKVASSSLESIHISISESLVKHLLVNSFE